MALRRAYPEAQTHGLAWSSPPTLLCAARCRFARVGRVDTWRADWSGYDLVYLFPRPESMGPGNAQGQQRTLGWPVAGEPGV